MYIVNVQVSGGKFTLNLDIDEVYTLTTLSLGNKGSYGDPPAPKDFPLPYTEDFQSKSTEKGSTS